MHHGKAKLPLGEILAEPLVVGVLCRLEVHVVVPDLEVDGYEVDERDVVTEGQREWAGSGRVSRGRQKCGRDEATHTSELERAIISLTAIRNRPPVSDRQLGFDGPDKAKK
jgi:hypothetical protein